MQLTGKRVNAQQWSARKHQCLIPIQGFFSFNGAIFNHNLLTNTKTKNHCLPTIPTYKLGYSLSFSLSLVQKYSFYLAPWPNEIVHWNSSKSYLFLETLLTYWIKGSLNMAKYVPLSWSFNQGDVKGIHILHNRNKSLVQLNLCKSCENIFILSLLTFYISI